MITHFIETTDGVAHGKFMLGWLDRAEIEAKSALPQLEGQSMWRNSGGARKFNPALTLVLDLQTAQGAGFLLSDRFKTRDELCTLRAWVCPMYRPTVLMLVDFLAVDGTFDSLPHYVEIDPLVKR